MLLYYFGRYSGPATTNPALTIPILKEPQLTSETPLPLAVDLKDRECGSSALVGGKGSSLALMTAVEESKVNNDDCTSQYRNCHYVFLSTRLLTQCCKQRI
jgi:hypothetical protein